MRIAILLLSGGLVNRGAEHSMLMLAEDFGKLGHQVTVFQSGHAPSGARYRTHQIQLPITPTSHKPTSFIGKVLERLYLNKRGLLTLLFSIKLSNCLTDYDLIIPTDGFWQVLIAKLFIKAKIVTVGLAGIGWTDRDTLRLNPDVFVALSSKAATWAKKINPNVNVATIPLQVDLKAFDVAPASIDLEKPIILTVAALTKYKRVDLVIKAVAKIPNVWLLIVGQGEERSNLEQLAEKLIPGRYQIKTAQFDDLPGIYKACDVFTLASEPQEAFGMVLVEAMAAGLPIVTTNDQIRTEIVGESGVYFSDTYQLSKKLEEALHKGKVSYPNLSKYDRQEIAKQYEKVFTN